VLFIPDPGYDFFHPRYRVDKISDQDPAMKLSILNPKNDIRFSKIRSGMFILGSRILELDFFHA
jgi:hypothetical protein